MFWPISICHSFGCCHKCIHEKSGSDRNNGGCIWAQLQEFPFTKCDLSTTVGRSNIRYQNCRLLAHYLFLRRPTITWQKVNNIQTLLLQTKTVIILNGYTYIEIWIYLIVHKASVLKVILKNRMFDSTTLGTTWQHFI